MTNAIIQEQIKTIRQATKKAGASKEAALVFLQQAGIINKPAVAVQSSKTHKSKKR